MSEEKTSQEEREWRGRPEEEAVRELLVSAGPRAELPEEDLAAIRDAARAEWRRRHAPPAAGRRWVLAAAAALVLSVGGLWWMGRPQPPAAPPPQVAAVELLTGSVRVLEAGAGAPSDLGPGEIGRLLAAGSEIETGAGPDRPGRVALRTGAGASLRLDAGTRVRLAAVDLIELRQGAVYVDTGGGGAGRGLAVRAEAGLFQDAGTQFEVRAEGTGPGAVTRLRVREGRVELDRATGRVAAGAGEALVLREGEVVRETVPLYGTDWDWVTAAAPRLEIEGVKVRAFLDWLARETGRRIEFADPEAASRAESVVLHGSIAHLSLAEATAVVLASAGLGHRLADGELEIFVAPAKDLPRPGI